VAELILISAMAVLTSFVLFTALPWLARRTAVLSLRDAREDLYCLGELVPKAETTSVYRDLEYLTTLSIRILREGTLQDAVGLFFAHVNARKLAAAQRGVEPDDLRWPQEEIDAVFVTPEAREQLRRVLWRVRLSVVPILWRILWAHPLCLIVGMLTVVLWVIPSSLLVPRSKEPAKQAKMVHFMAQSMRKAESVRSGSRNLTPAW
jgi:hypothetical protein